MILFFDTETTGLPKNWKAPITDLDNWPRLVQLAYLIYDFRGNLIYSCNEIVKPNGFTIPKEASNVHGITTEKAIQRGSDINDVFELFNIHLKRSKVIVAHNMAYDEKIIGSELIRLGIENLIDDKEKICTMESTVDLCKIEGPYGFKWPKLEELHRFLFKCDFEGAHDALADIQATAKCFWELRKMKEINCEYINTKREIQKMELSARIANLITPKNNQITEEDSKSIIKLLESNPEFTLSLLSLHYSFSAYEINLYWDILIKGDAHYSYYMSDNWTLFKPKYGLCFNRNINWTKELIDKWTLGIWDPFIGVIVGTNIGNINIGEESKIQNLIPLNIKEEFEILNNCIILNWQDTLEPGDINENPDEFEGPNVINTDIYNQHLVQLDFSEFELIYKEKKSKILYNESIWENTLKEILTKEWITQFLMSQLKIFKTRNLNNPINDEKNKVIEDAINLNKSILISYLNYDNELTERIVSEVNFSLNVLSEESLEQYNIDFSYISGKCLLRNEMRTFKIERIKKIELIDNDQSIQNGQNEEFVDLPF